jgi:hypothetical protein
MDKKTGVLLLTQLVDSVHRNDSVVLCGQVPDMSTFPWLSVESRVSGAGLTELKGRVYHMQPSQGPGVESQELRAMSREPG